MKSKILSLLLGVLVIAFSGIPSFVHAADTSSSTIPTEVAEKVSSLLSDIQTKLDMLPKQKALSVAKNIETKLKALSLRKYKNDSETKIIATFLALKVREMREKIAARTEATVKTTDFSSLFQSVQSEITKADAAQAQKQSSSSFSGNSFLKGIYK